MSNLKPLVWSEVTNNTSIANSATYFYDVVKPDINGTFIVRYISKQQEAPIREATGFATMNDAKEWAWNHYNEKMQPYVNQDSITRTESWFKAAKPEPTNADICTQIGCHFEEFAEMHLSLGDSKMCHFIDQNANDYKKGYTNSIVGMMTREHGGLSKVELLDSLCDQIVTAVGVGYMMGFDMQSALNEVIRSNDSKMVNGTFEFDANGKIMKPDSYSKPDLTPYMKELTND